MENMTRDINSIVKQAGLKGIIAERMGFKRECIILLESSERDNEITWVAFEVNGQGYTWDIQQDHFAINNAYGDRFFGEEE